MAVRSHRSFYRWKAVKEVSARDQKFWFRIAHLSRFHLKSGQNPVPITWSDLFHSSFLIKLAIQYLTIYRTETYVRFSTLIGSQWPKYFWRKIDSSRNKKGVRYGWTRMGIVWTNWTLRPPLPKIDQLENRIESIWKIYKNRNVRNRVKSFLNLK